MMGAGKSRRIDQPGHLLTLVAQQGEVKEAIGQVEARSVFKIFAPDAGEVEHALVEFGRAVKVAADQGHMADTRARSAIVHQQ